MSWLVRRSLRVLVVTSLVGGGGYGVAAATVLRHAEPAITSASGAVSGAVAGVEHAAGGQLALTALATLPVKGRAPKTGYSRAQFGQAWADVNRNGCDTRNDILNRDLTGKTIKQGTRGCKVLAGTLADPYTGHVIAFRRGPDSAKVQIDHVVALSNAWQTGAAALPSPRRLQLANDPLNLLAVDGPTNEAKGDGDAATWLPPVKAFRCAYVARQVEVKAKYGLWLTAPEKLAISRVLARCPMQRVP